MKVSNRLIAGLGMLVVSANALVHAAPPDQRGGYGDHGPGRYQDHGAQYNRGDDHRGGRPPEDFSDVRRTIQEHREIIGRGQPLPPDVHIVKGHPLPRGYGRRLDERSLQYLPRYDGYEWRRLGPDIVLVAIGSGIVYEILDGVLN